LVARKKKRTPHVRNASAEKRGNKQNLFFHSQRGIQNNCKKGRVCCGEKKKKRKGIALSFCIARGACPCYGGGFEGRMGPYMSRGKGRRKTDPMLCGLP